MKRFESPQADTETRNCPMCSGRGGQKLRTIDRWDIIACSQCGFAYVPLVRRNTATELEFPDDFQPTWRARHRQIYRLLRDRLPSGDLIVDVGAGFAELGRVVQAEGRHRYVGFEPSQSVARQALKRGIVVRPEIFTDKSLSESAGAVILDNVLEHLASPLDLLKTCANALRPGGILVVIVPNRYDVRQCLSSWRFANHWIPPEHINYFTAANLRKALADVGVQARPFGFSSIGIGDYKYWPRALLENINVYPFGLNVYGYRS